jgi:hypothetical protein
MKIDNKMKWYPTQSKNGEKFLINVHAITYMVLEDNIVKLYFSETQYSTHRFPTREEAESFYNGIGNL